MTGFAGVKMRIAEGKQNVIEQPLVNELRGSSVRL